MYQEQQAGPSGSPQIESVAARVAALRRLPPATGVADALAATGRLWRHRLAGGWTPPPDAQAFPWAITRRSLVALLPGLHGAQGWQGGDAEAISAHVVALVLAGNTPLMSWSPLCAALLSGATVFVKMSRDETQWPRLFRDALAEVAPDVAARIALNVWPGANPPTGELVRAADAVVAFGSDPTIAALRAATPAATPFFPYGHAISIGACAGDTVSDNAIWGFARDTLMYGQGGCLSPQTLFVAARADIPDVCARLARAFAHLADTFPVAPVSDPAHARAVRNARDLALFDGADVTGDPHLRWTIIRHRETILLPTPTGWGILSVVPIQHHTDLPRLTRDWQGRISCVGLAGANRTVLAEIRCAMAVNRVCKPGQMQTPPLDWPNGGFDLLAALRTRWWFY